MPPLTATPPVPAMVPAKLPAPLVTVRVCAPSTTAPEPDRALICGAAMPETSSTPLSVTPLELAMAVALPRARVAPLAMLVAPV